ncbi:MAG: histone H1 [Muribaculaceae bacterium]|nr:histone H1 [Muribaculaceae bacterium]
MKDLIDKISELCDSFRINAQAQLVKGNKAAGLRARRVSLDLEPLLKQFRKLSLDAANPGRETPLRPRDL